MGTVLVVFCGGRCGGVVTDGDGDGDGCYGGAVMNVLLGSDGDEGGAGFGICGSGGGFVGDVAGRWW